MTSAERQQRLPMAETHNLGRTSEGQDRMALYGLVRERAIPHHIY